MANGFEINITESEFKAKPQAEQGWILFQGISAVRKCVNDIDQFGCEFARKKHKQSTVKVLSAMAGSIAFALGIVYVVFHLLHHGS